MDDQTELFAQLTRLRAQGLLTDAEYEAKTAAVRARGTSHTENILGFNPGSDNSRPTTKARFAYGGLLFLAILGFAGVVISQVGRSAGIKSSTAATGVETAGTVSGAAGADSVANAPVKTSREGWTATTERDPMTDVSYRQVAALFSGEQSDAEVLVRCGSDGMLGYTISTFDKDGQPAPMRMNEAGPSISGLAPAGSSQTGQPRVSPGYTFIRYEIRTGSDRPIPIMLTRPQYNNQVTLIGPPGSKNAALLSQLACSNTVTVRLQMPYGEETYQWGQAVEPFMSIMTPCMQAQQKAQTTSPFTAKDAGEQKM